MVQERKSVNASQEPIDFASQGVDDDSALPLIAGLVGTLHVNTIAMSLRLGQTFGVDADHLLDRAARFGMTRGTNLHTQQSCTMRSVEIAH